MSSRGTAIKLALLAVPLVAGVASLRAFGEPVGRAARIAAAAISYPAYDHGGFLVRVSRGSDYHVHVARTLEEFLRGRISTLAEAKPPARVTVLVVEEEEDLERFGLDPRRLDRRGLSDVPSATLALVSSGRPHNVEQDSRVLRREMARLLFSRACGRWVVEGMAAQFEGPPPAGSEGELSGNLVPLSVLLRASEAAYRGPAGARLVESARLLVAFLLEEDREELGALLRGELPPLLEDLDGLEASWREWVRLSLSKRKDDPRQGDRPK